jgi:flavorubredoxin
MKALIVYQSRYGNCEKVAQEILAGMREIGADADLAEVQTAGLPGADTDVIVVGSPTRAGKATGKIRKYMDSLGSGSGSNARFVAFGTGLIKWLDKGEMAADFIHTEMTDKGFTSMMDPVRFGVEKTKGPLVEGELEKARELGKRIAST